MEANELKAALEKNLKGLGCGKTLGHGYSCGPGSYICSECKTLQAQAGPLLELFAENDRLTEEYDKAWRHDLNEKNNVQVLTAEVVRLNAEIEDFKQGAKAEADAGDEAREEVRQLKAEVDRLKQEKRLLTEHNEFLASSDSRLAPELRAVKDALGLDFTASVSGEVVPAIEKLRKGDERYQWLRSRIPGSAYRIAGVIYSEGGLGVDAGIDAAMSKEGK